MKFSLFSSTKASHKTIAGVMAVVLLVSPTGQVLAQVQAPSGSLVTAQLDKAVGNVSIGVKDSVAKGLGNAIDDGIEGIQTGNVIGDSVAQGAAGAIGGFLACQVGGLLGGAGGLASSAAGLTVPVSDAQVLGSTKAQELKDCTLDGLAFALKEGIIKGLVKGLIVYVNNGFDGGPAYVTNEDAYFQDQADDLFEQYLDNPNNFSSVCSAWEADVRLALASQYSTNTGGRRVTQLSGTGTGTNAPISSGPSVCPLDNGGFATGETGGDYWGTFLEQTTNTQGNAVTAYFDIQETIVASIEKEAEKGVRELQRNKGFFDVTYCEDDSAVYKSINSENKVTINQKECKITTPGGIIESQLNEALGSDGRRIEAADELNELFTALIGQLVNAAFSKKGLAGTTARNGDSASLVERYAETVNPAIKEGSREVLVGLLDEYRAGISEFIAIKQDTIKHLADARIAAEGAYLCYGSKYDTWVTKQDMTLIPPDKVATTPLDKREQATFTYNQIVGTGNNQTTLTAYLAPEQSGAKITEYQKALTDIGGYVSQTQKEIDTAILNRDEATLLRTWLTKVETSKEPLAAALADSNIVKLIASKFAEVDTSNLTLIRVPLDDGTFVEIPKELSEQQLLEVFAIASEELAQFEGQAAINQRRLVEIAATDLVSGVQETVGGPRIGGFNKDLNQCNLFQTITEPIVTEETTPEATS